MRSTVTAMVLIAILLAGALPAPAASVRYTVATPDPDGQISCPLVIGGDLGDRVITVQIRLRAGDGEARIADLGISAGTQDGCDVFPDTPDRTKVRLGPGIVALFLSLDVHSHPGSQCTVGAVATGKIKVRGSGSGALEVAVLPPCQMD